MKYAICQIKGKQYKVEPGRALEIDLATDEQKDLSCKVLLISEEGKFRVGKPFLKDELTLNILENVKGEKLRVGKYHSKANFRRVTGQRAQHTKVILDVKKP